MLRVMTVNPVARGTGPDPRVEVEVRGAALGQLLAGGPLAESVHVVLVLVVAALVWNSMPLARTLGWVGAVTAAAALRTWWRLGLGRRAPTPEQALRGVRLTVAGVGLAWGFGAAAAIPELGVAQAALILVVLSGIVAGATGTLVGDRRSFRYLLITTLAPLPVGILLQGHARIQLIAVLLIALFAWSMDRVHRRAHRTFAERVRATVLLESSKQELARQHGYLDALIASTPVAIAVLDSGRSIHSVNPAFEKLFGYSAAEAAGATIDALIVPESLRSDSSDLETRARGGEIVRVEVERRRKDGSPIQVRLSAAAVKATAEGALVALYEDISDRKAAELAMRAARDLASSAALRSLMSSYSATSAPSAVALTAAADSRTWIGLPSLRRRSTSTRTISPPRARASSSPDSERSASGTTNPSMPAPTASAAEYPNSVSNAGFTLRIDRPPSSTAIATGVLAISASR